MKNKTLGVPAVEQSGCSDVFEYAKYFLKHNLDTTRNTFDGNMKLQKLLVLANLISLAERGIPLFADEILAFEQGCVIEKVRLRYKNDLTGFLADSVVFNPDFSQDVYDILNLTIAIFGNLSARELSELNHSFSFWNNAFNNSKGRDGFRDKGKAIVTVEAMSGELDSIRNAIAAFRDTQSEYQSKEIINEIEFYYVPGEINFTDEVMDQLYAFSRVAEERAYSVYFDNGSLVIY